MLGKWGTLDNPLTSSPFVYHILQNPVGISVCNGGAWLFLLLISSATEVTLSTTLVMTPVADSCR